LEALVNGLLLGTVYGLAGIGLAIIFGVLHIVNFAVGELIVLGAYTTFWICTLFNVNPIFALPISSLAMLIIFYAIEKLNVEPLLKSSEFALMTLLVTYALSLLIRNLQVALWTGDFRIVPTPPEYSFTVSIGGTYAYFIRILAFIISIAVTILLYLFFTRTMTGRAIRAIADDLEAARLVGVSPTRIFRITFGIAGITTAIAGSLLGMIYPFNPASGTVYGTKAFIVVVLGGMGSMVGAFTGGILLGLVEIFSGILWVGGMKEVVSYIFFIAVLLLRPSGLFKGRV
jgi:branched-chain amino acid transport system permease protein